MARSQAIYRAAASITLALWLAGCNGYKAATPENFTRAINAYYAENNDCLFPGGIRFPYEISTKDHSSAAMVKSLDALTTAGLLQRIEEPSIHIKRYSLTPYARRSVSGRFCYGHRVVTSVVGFTPPAPLNGQQSSQVTYQYKMMDVPGWAQSDDMRTKFPALAKDTGDQAQAAIRLVLTINGWRVPE